MHRAWAWALAWLLCTLPLFASAVPGELRLPQQDHVELGRAFVWLADPGGALQLQDVLSPQQQQRMRPVPPLGPGANFGLTRAAIWLQLTVHAPAQAPRDWLLEVAYPPLDNVQLFVSDGQGGFSRAEAGDLLPYEVRAVAHRNHVLPVRLAPGGATTLLLRVQSSGTVSVPARLWRPHALWAQDQATYATLSLYFGLLIGLLLYNLLLFVSVRDIGYLFYVAFAAALGVGQAALTGVGYQFVWTHWTWWNGVSVPVGMSLAAIFGLQFARHFLSSAVRLPVWDRVLLAQIVGWACAMLAALLLPYQFASRTITVLALVSAVTLSAMGMVSIRRQFAGAQSFFTAWALLLLGVFTLSLHNTGVLPSNAFTSNALLIGSALEMVLLSFALADRINVARRFKEQAQARIAAEHAMVEALSQSQRRLRTVLEEREIVLENSIVGICFLSADGRLRWANKAMLQIFGARAQQVSSMEPFYLSRAQYLEVGGEVAAAVARGDVYQRELPVQQYDGTRIWILLSGKAVSPSDLAQGTVWVIMDITQRKQLEAQLQRSMVEREAILHNAVEQQKALNALRSRFVAMTSHEFRTPLAAILSSGELLRHYGDRLPAVDRNEILDSISDGVQRMSRMLDRVLLLGRADAQMLEFRPGEVDLPRLCAQLVADARAEQPAARCEVRLQCAPDVGTGHCDEKLLRHILGNLLSNAIKYSPEGGTVRFGVVREGGCIVFEVRDEGIGIPADEIAHLFESFHRASNVGAIPGTGLGLAIVKNAVEVHRGTISVGSELGRGTRFTVRLPA